MKIYDKIDQLVGNTPLFEPKNLEKDLKLKGKILLKLESFNPTGSVKDRVALAMLNDAEKQGKITCGGTVIEPTSGNTGIGLSAIATSRGYKAVIVMPDSMSVERIKLLKAYGAKVVLTDGKKGMQGSIEKAKEINQTTPNSIIVGQFENPSNPKAHYENTGREIYRDTDGKIDYLVAGIGTGGTLSGTGKYLKEQNPNVKVIGVEPSDSPLITKGKAGAHKIQGIGANFLPKVFDESVVDQVVTASTEEAYFACRKLASKEGLLLGISSGAALSKAIELARKEENKNKVIVAIMPDTGDRYLSTDLYE